MFYRPHRHTLLDATCAAGIFQVLQKFDYRHESISIEGSIFHLQDRLLRFLALLVHHVDVEPCLLLYEVVAPVINGFRKQLVHQFHYNYSESVWQIFGVKRKQQLVSVRPVSCGCRYGTG